MITDKEYEIIITEAHKNAKKWEKERGPTQMIYPQDGFDYWVMNACKNLWCKNEIKN